MQFSSHFLKLKAMNNINFFLNWKTDNFVPPLFSNSNQHWLASFTYNKRTGPTVSFSYFFYILPNPIPLKRQLLILDIMSRNLPTFTDFQISYGKFVFQPDAGFIPDLLTLLQKWLVTIF